MTPALETAARELAEGLARSLPVTSVSVAVRDQPSSDLTVRAVSASRVLAGAPAVGTRLALSSAPWHRIVLERQEAVLVEAGVRPPAAHRAEAEALTPPFQSALLLPIRVGGDTVGVVTLGEMRSPAREPFSDEKRRRCQTVLEGLVTAAPAWQLGRLHREMQTTAGLVRLIRRLSGVRSPAGLLESLGIEVAHWFGVPVWGVLLRATADRRAEVVAEWRPPRTLEPGEATQLLLAVVRALDERRGPVSVVPVTDDPLHGEVEHAPGTTRIGLPLVVGDRLLGVVGLYLGGSLFLAPWETQALGGLADAVSAWLEVVTVAEESARQAEILRAATWDLLPSHRRLVTEETVGSAIRSVSTDLPGMVRRLAGELDPGPAGDDRRWDRLADATTAEVSGLLGRLRGASRPVPRELNDVVRQALDLAGAEPAPSAPARRGSVRLVTVGGATPVVVGPGFVPALARVVRSLRAGLPVGGTLVVRTRRVGAEAVVEVGPRSPSEPAGPPLVSGFQEAEGPLRGLRSAVASTGGRVAQEPAAPEGPAPGSRGPGLEVRLPLATLVGNPLSRRED